MTMNREREVIELEQGWAVMQKGITKLKNLLEGVPDQQFNSKEYIMFYKTIYKMCTQKPPQDYSQQLYDRYRESFEEYINSTVLPALREKHDEFMLRELVMRWDNHKIMVRLLSRFFNYLDRYFIARKSLPALSEVGLMCFRDLVYAEMKPNVKDAVITLIDREREGEQIDRALLKSVLGIFVEIGMGNMDVYEMDFEGFMLQDTAAYYSHKAASWIEEDSCPDYMLKAEECLKREKERVGHYLHKSSEQKLLEKVQHELLTKYENHLLEKEHSGCDALLRDDKVEDLSRMYRLFCRVSRGLEPVAAIFCQHVTDEGTMLVKQAADAASSNKGEKKDILGAQEQAFVCNVNELHDKCLLYVSECFLNDSLFHEALKEAFCNISEELLIDSLKKGGSEKLSDEAIEDTSEKVGELLAYIGDQDLFAELWRIDGDTSASSLTSSSNEGVPQHPSLQQLRDESDPSTVVASMGTTTTEDFFTRATTPGMGSGKDSQLESHEIGFFPDFPCTTDGDSKQENQFSTIGISDTTQSGFQPGLQEILTKGRKGKFEGADSIEFLFKQAEDMSKVVGVGLSWSKVVVTKQFGVVVKHIGEHSWSDLWKETSFSPMSIRSRKPPFELSTCNLTPEQSSKIFGVGLVGSRLEYNRVYVKDNQNQTGEMFPFIFELAEKMGLSENANDSNFQQPSSISSEAVEGEKNDHGGPSLETMEGGGETNQGGTSSQPMDPMDVGESSQGGNSDKPMEGVESGQGGPSSGPTEVGGQRDQQSSPFKQRLESLQAKGPQNSNENKTLTVIVILEPGGVFYEADGKQPARADSRIEDAAIAPWLKFKFEILGGERNITTTTHIICDLGEGGALRLHEDWNFAYCHDNIKVSLTCGVRQAVRLLHRTVDAMNVTKRTMTDTSTGSRSRANQLSSQIGAQAQLPVVHIGIQAQGTSGVTNTVGHSRALAMTTDSSYTEFAGFGVIDHARAHSLAFTFLYPENIVDVKARGERKEFMLVGISKTLEPVIIGTWVPLDTEEACPYSFQTDRAIYSIGSLSTESEKPKYVQSYVVQFLINHALSHIHSKVDTELRGYGKKSADGVLTKFPELK